MFGSRHVISRNLVRILQATSSEYLNILWKRPHVVFIESQQSTTKLVLEARVASLSLSSSQSFPKPCFTSIPTTCRRFFLDFSCLLCSRDFEEGDGNGDTYCIYEMRFDMRQTSGEEEKDDEEEKTGHKLFSAQRCHEENKRSSPAFSFFNISQTER